MRCAQLWPARRLAAAAALLAALVSPAASAPPPSLSAESMEGLKITLPPAAKRATLVTIWNTHMDKADALAKSCVELYRRFHERGLDAVTFWTDGSESPVIEFTERWNPPWPQALSSAVQPDPLAAFGVKTAPAAFLVTPSSMQQLDPTQSQAHDLVAAALGVNLKEVPLPTTAAARKTSQEQRGPDIGALAVALSDMRANPENADRTLEVIAKLLEESKAGTGVPEAIADEAWQTLNRRSAKLFAAAMPKLPVKDQLRLNTAVMTRIPDGIEAIFPEVAKIDEKALPKEASAWDISQFGRTLTLSGQPERGAKVLRELAAGRKDSVAWWYPVGWSELICGRAEPAREALSRCYAPNGKYENASLELAGNVAGLFLGAVSEEKFLKDRDSVLGPFFVGERRLLSGDRAAAAESYRHSVRALKPDRADPWPANWAAVRIKQLDSKLPGLPKELPPAARLWEQKITASQPAATRPGCNHAGAVNFERSAEHP